MRVVVLMGSPRKKDGYNICKLIEASLVRPGEIEFEYVFLKDYRIDDCKGCGQCFSKGEVHCPCKDELHLIKSKLLQADGIVFVSPVYACQITGLMKRTFDRLSYLFHRQELVGKPALTVVTTGGGGQRPTGKYMKLTACGWGCNLVGELDIIAPLFFQTTAPQSAWGYSEKYHASRLKKIQGLAHRFESALSTNVPPIPSFYDIYMFQCLRSKTFVSKADHDFWREQGWLESDYFYNTRLNIAKALFGRMLRGYVNLAAHKFMARSGPIPDTNKAADPHC